VIAVDTHALIWWVTSQTDRLSLAGKRALDGELQGGKVFVSSITAWEIAILVARGRIELAGEPQEWLATVGRIGPVEFVPVDNEIAVRSTKLGDIFHRDPADRFIVATLMKLGVPPVTADEKIRRYPHITTIW
jgi:PIN domain nuclease of toxin-antitoxin system